MAHSTEKRLLPVPTSVDAPAGVLSCITRTPMAAPALIEISAVACVSSLMARLVTVMLPSWALFSRKSTSVAPENPAPARVRTRFVAPRLPRTGDTDVTTGSRGTVTGAAARKPDEGAPQTLSGRLTTVGKIGPAAKTLTDAVTFLSTRSKSAILTLTPDDTTAGSPGRNPTVSTVADPCSVGSSLWMAVTVTVAGDGMLPGAVYKPSDEIVPRSAPPPGTPFT